MYIPLFQGLTPVPNVNKKHNSPPPATDTCARQHIIKTGMRSCSTIKNTRPARNPQPDTGKYSLPCCLRDLYSLSKANIKSPTNKGYKSMRTMICFGVVRRSFTFSHEIKPPEIFRRAEISCASPTLDIFTRSCYNASAEVIPALSGDSPFPVSQAGRGAALFHWQEFTTFRKTCQEKPPDGDQRRATGKAR